MFCLKICVSVVILCGVLVLFHNCHGYCFFGPILAEMTVSRRFRYYCEYGHDGRKMRLFPGSRLYLVDGCLDCECTDRGLQCCGFGHQAGIIGVRGCKVLHDGCQPLLVKPTNESLDCFTNKPLNYTDLGLRPHPDSSIGSPKVTQTDVQPQSTNQVPESEATVPQQQSINPVTDNSAPVFNYNENIHSQGFPSAGGVGGDLQQQQLLRTWLRSLQPNQPQTSPDVQYQDYLPWFLFTLTR